MWALDVHAASAFAYIVSDPCVHTLVRVISAIKARCHVVYGEHVMFSVGVHVYIMWWL